MKKYLDLIHFILWFWTTRKKTAIIHENMWMALATYHHIQVVLFAVDYLEAIMNHAFEWLSKWWRKKSLTNMGMIDLWSVITAVAICWPALRHFLGCSDKAVSIQSLTGFPCIVLLGNRSDNNHLGSSGLLGWPVMPSPILLQMSSTLSSQSWQSQRSTLTMGNGSLVLF